MYNSTHEGHLTNQDTFLCPRLERFHCIKQLVDKTQHCNCYKFPFYLPILFAAVTPMDYGSLSSLVLSFGACDTRHCGMIPIVDDMTLEQEETLSVVLESTEGGLHTRISLVRINGQITISDNDGETCIAYVTYIYLPLPIPTSFSIGLHMVLLLHAIISCRAAHILPLFLCIIFGTAIPTSFSILMKIFLLSL